MWTLTNFSRQIQIDVFFKIFVRRNLKLDVNMNNILQFVLVLIFYEGQVFSEFSIKILNGCSFDINFDFPHNFKTTDWLDWLKFSHKLSKRLWLMIKKAKYLNFQQNVTVHKLMHHLGLETTWLKSYVLFHTEYSLPNTEAKKAFRQHHNTILAQNQNMGHIC